MRKRSQKSGKTISKIQNNLRYFETRNVITVLTHPNREAFSSRGFLRFKKRLSAMNACLLRASANICSGVLFQMPLFNPSEARVCMCAIFPARVSIESAAMRLPLTFIESVFNQSGIHGAHAVLFTKKFPFGKRIARLLYDFLNRGFINFCVKSQGS